MYTPPPGHDFRGKVIQDSRYRTKGTKRRKDPDAPKRSCGAFIFFCSEERPKLKAEMPDIKLAEMNTILGERWRALPFEELIKYEIVADEDRARSRREMAAYNATL